MADSKDSYAAKIVKISIAVASYWIVSISMVFLNKSLLSGEYKIDAPIFVTWFQCLVAVPLLWVCGSLGTVWPALSFFPPVRFSWDTCRKVMPLSIVFVAMIVFNNLCLKHVSVSFYNVGRSLTTVFNVALTFFVLGTPTSMAAGGCCLVIIGGFLLGIDQEVDVSMLGVFFGICASLAVALNSIFVKKVFHHVDNDAWRLTAYNNLNACFLFIPFITLETKVLREFELLYSLQFWTLMTLAGFLGVAIGVVTGYQIRLTSPLTHNVSGTAKACAQTVMAVSIYNEYKTPMWWVSNFMVLFGSAAYSRVRQLEMKAEHEASLGSK